MSQFAFGVDLGWVTQLETLGYTWVNESGEAVDAIAAAKALGADSVRLRIFVDPPKSGFWQKREDEECMLGFCDGQSVLAAAKRVKEQGMRLMLDFHYSDHFADPQFQDIPKAWENDDIEALKAHVYEHTENVLGLFRESGIEPEWVQVGNEINPGICFPMGKLDEHPDYLVEILNSGYDAVKAVFPACSVITHLACVQDQKWCVPFWDNFFRRGGKTDILGFSFYPYWYQAPSDKQMLQECLEYYSGTYGKPVLIAEVGGLDDDVEGTKKILCDSIEACLDMKGGPGLGAFYWEPEVNRQILPDHYPLGAARLLDEKTLQYTEALSVYKKYQ